MASRDNQTMQIIVIVLALGFILMSVGLVLVNNSRKTAVARAKDASDKASEANRAQNQLQAEANAYKVWIGYAEADTYQALSAPAQDDGQGGMFEEDMKRWGSTFDEASRSYRNILENIFDENNKLAQSESDAKAQLKTIKQQLLATQAQTNEQIAKYKADYEKSVQDKESLRNDYTAARQKIDEEKDKISQQLADQRDKFDEMVTQNETAKQELMDKISKLERVIEILKSKTAIPDPYAQPEDGRIAWVNQREGKVWINLGSADELRPQVTFSVYSGDANDVNAAEKKGSVEILRILSDHMAEARITYDQPTRPLMEGDKVYSQVWNRGRQIGFAVTGVIDLNDDGSDDIDQLVRIIQVNNGKVDAVPTKDGGMDGQMTVDTRYLILGKHPDDSRAVSVAARKAYQVMTKEADTLNIEVITLDEFLSLMGWVSEHRAIKIGRGARSEDFPATPREDVKPRTLNNSKNLFRPRKPQPSY